MLNIAFFMWLISCKFCENGVENSVDNSVESVLKVLKKYVEKVFNSTKTHIYMYQNSHLAQKNRMTKPQNRPLNIINIINITLLSLRAKKIKK